MYEGMTKTQRRKLVRFKRLAARGARVRRLLRPILGDLQLVRLPEVANTMAAIRLRQAPRRKP